MDIEQESQNPLIFTKNGYIRQNDMQFFKKWSFGEGFIKYTEGYTHNGEIVKEGHAVFVTQGHDMNSLQGEF